MGVKTVIAASLSAAAISAFIMSGRPVTIADLKAWIIDLSHKVRSESVPKPPGGLVSQFLLEMDDVRKAVSNVQMKDGNSTTCAAFSHVVIEAVRHWNASTTETSFETFMRKDMGLSPTEFDNFFDAFKRCENYTTREKEGIYLD